MILPLVSELLARVARRPVVEETFEALRRTGGEVRLAGLTDSAKALLIPLAFAELGRPTVLLVATNQRAEALLEPVRYFYRAVTGKPGRRVAPLPAHEIPNLCAGVATSSSSNSGSSNHGSSSRWVSTCLGSWLPFPPNYRARGQT